MAVWHSSASVFETEGRLWMQTAKYLPCSENITVGPQPLQLRSNCPGLTSAVVNGVAVGGLEKEHTKQRSGHQTNGLWAVGLPSCHDRDGLSCPCAELEHLV